ncbi:MAG: hypothetical protein HPY57_12685 [Ignavibacteria bacterium]|nr:hypothetical protein [Ignavibacteria bacterium]
MITIGNESSKIYTGLAECKVVTINPTKQELKELGINYTNDPEYLSASPDGNKLLRLDIWLKILKTGTLTKLSIFLEDVTATSSNEKIQFIDKRGNAIYVSKREELSNYEWIDLKSARPAIKGETKLINFLKSWLKVPKDGVATIDNMDSLLRGNVSELKKYVELAKDYKIVVLLTVKNGYQSVWTDMFGKSVASAPLFIKALEKSVNKPEFQNSFEFKEFTGVQYETNMNESEASEDDANEEDSLENIW